MINYNIDFIINKNITIRFCLNTNVKLLECCQDTDIILLKNNKSYLLGSGDLKDKMYVLKNALKKAVENQHQLHPSITEDIGYLYNEELQFKPGFVYEKFENLDYWVGRNYLLWNYDLATWLYNDFDGNIILHITSIYLGNWIGEGDDEETDKLVYETWMAIEYKPFWTITLPKETARLWLRLAENIFSKVP